MSSSQRDYEMQKFLIPSTRYEEWVHRRSLFGRGNDTDYYCLLCDGAIWDSPIAVTDHVKTKEHKSNMEKLQKQRETMLNCYLHFEKSKGMLAPVQHLPASYTGPLYHKLFNNIPPKVQPFILPEVREGGSFSVDVNDPFEQVYAEVLHLEQRERLLQLSLAVGKMTCQDQALRSLTKVPDVVQMHDLMRHGWKKYATRQSLVSNEVCIIIKSVATWLVPQSSYYDGFQLPPQLEFARGENVPVANRGKKRAGFP